MTPLRRRMIEDLTLRGYAERTVEAYVRAVAQLAAFYDRSPDQLSEEDLRRYLVSVPKPLTYCHERRSRASRGTTVSVMTVDL